MNSTTTMEAPPMVHAGEQIIPAADNRTMLRRLSDKLPGQPLDWGGDGTPFEGSTVVYLCRVRDALPVRWSEIHTKEHLLDVQAEPTRYEVRTLFTVPVDELSRSPLALVAAAATKLDIIRAGTGAAIANMRAVAREIAEMP
jgi:hypothetical protein